MGKAPLGGEATGPNSTDRARNVATLLGIGLLSARMLGAYAWVGPIAYAVVAEYALTANRTSPWIFPTRATPRSGRSERAALMVVLGITVTAGCGPRERQA